MQGGEAGIRAGGECEEHVEEAQAVCDKLPEPAEVIHAQAVGGDEGALRDETQPRARAQPARAVPGGPLEAHWRGGLGVPARHADQLS